MSWLKPVMQSPKRLFMAAFSSDSDKSLFKVNAARKSKVDDNTAKMQSIKQLGV